MLCTPSFNPKAHTAAEMSLTFRCSHVNDAPKPRWSGWKHAACLPACSQTPARGLVSAAGVTAKQDSAALSSHLLLDSASVPPVLVTWLRTEQFPRFLVVEIAEELPPVTAGRQQACGGLKLKQGGDVPVSFPRFFKSEGRGVLAHLPGGWATQRQALVRGRCSRPAAPPAPRSPDTPPRRQPPRTSWKGNRAQVAAVKTKARCCGSCSRVFFGGEAPRGGVVPPTWLLAARARRSGRARGVCPPSIGRTRAGPAAAVGSRAAPGRRPPPASGGKSRRSWGGGSWRGGGRREK